MHGGPSQLDLFDHKPQLRQRHGEELPPSIRGNQRLTGMTSGQESKPVTSSLFEFSRHGSSGAWVSELLPRTAGMVDDLCFVRSVHCSNSRHGGALLELHTGSDTFTRPSMGSWLLYGLGAETDQLPGYVVLTSVGGGQSQPIAARQCCLPSMTSFPASPSI